ncbi:MAG: hypothetical protein KZQ97_13310 [Candidatus Thiodiazotropha sp. (ex Dulcina madagascariensis)]|nr:hypothetical protein [Candidatus Thiodiazotropha sp. (ex Dulcina madagascariensis)]
MRNSGHEIRSLQAANQPVNPDADSAVVEFFEDVADVLEAAFNLAKDALITVLKAIDQLSRTLAELLEWLATKTYDIVKRGVEALLEIGKSIGNILSQMLQFTYTLIRSSVQALLELGKTLIEILEAAVTRPGDLFNQIVRSMRDLGNSLAELFDEVVDAGADLVKEIAEAAAEIGATLVEFTTYLATLDSGAAASVAFWANALEEGLVLALDVSETTRCIGMILAAGDNQPSLGTIREDGTVESLAPPYTAESPTLAMSAFIQQFLNQDESYIQAGEGTIYCRKR